MYLHGFHIDGFGIFHNQGARDIPNGLVLFVGENESGKTTLMEFIRTVLFGLPRRGRNSYLPLRGGSHGGRVQFVMPNGRHVTVERAGKRVKITEEGGATEQEEPQKRLLGGIDRQTFERVFAIGLDDLQGLDVLAQEEVRGRLLSAGTGLGAASLPQTLKLLDKELDDLLTPRGRSQIIVVLKKRLQGIDAELRSLREQAADYARTRQRKADLEEHVHNAKKKTDALRIRLTRIEQLENAREPWISLDTARKNKKQVDYACSFPANGLERFEALIEKIGELEEEKSKAENEAAQLEMQLEGLIVDEAVLEREQCIEELAGEREKLASAIRDLPERRRDLNRDREAFEARLNDLGKDWTSERLAQVDLSVQVRQMVQDYQRRLQAAERDEQETRSRLLAIQDHKTTPLLPRGLLVAAIGIAAALAATLAFQGSYPTAVGVLIAGAVMGGLLYRYRRRQQEHFLDAKQRLEKVQHETAKAAQTLQQVVQEWRTWLGKQRFEETTRPDGFEVVLRAIEAARTAEQTFKNTQRRLDAIHEYVTSAQSRIRALSTECDVDLASSDPGADAVDAMLRALKNARMAAGERRKLDIRRNGFLAEARRLAGNLSKQQEELRALMQKAEARDEEKFRALAEANRQWRTAVQRIETNELALKTNAGTSTDAALQSFVDEMGSTDAAQLTSERIKLLGGLEEIDKTTTIENQEIGKLKEALIKMAHDEQLAKLLMERESLRQQLSDAVRRWATLSVCRSLLEDARDRYERERQPNVIKQADGFLRTLVSDRYRLIASVGEHSIGLEGTESMRRKEEDAWSSGLADQVYLATRLGLAREFGRHAQPLPVILDDILVRFDPVRRAAAVRVVIEFAKEQQVLLFSCHPDLMQTVLGAHQDEQLRETPVAYFQIADGSISLCSAD